MIKKIIKNKVQIYKRRIQNKILDFLEIEEEEDQETTFDIDLESLEEPPSHWDNFNFATIDIQTDHVILKSKLSDRQILITLNKEYHNKILNSIDFLRYIYLVYLKDVESQMYPFILNQDMISEYVSLLEQGISKNEMRNNKDYSASVAWTVLENINNYINIQDFFQTRKILLDKEQKEIKEWSIKSLQLLRN